MKQNKPIEDVINECELYLWIIIASIIIVFILCIFIFIVLEQRKDLQQQIEMLANSNQSLIDNLILKP